MDEREDRHAHDAFVFPNTLDSGFSVLYRGESKDYTQSSHWETSVTTSVQQSFGATEVSGEVSSSYGQEISKTFSESLEFSESEEQSHTFPSGTVWQYATVVEDICGATTSIKDRNLALTQGAFEKPCCLPGYFANPHVAHGKCMAGSPCYCELDLCNGYISGGDSDEDPGDIVDKPSEEEGDGSGEGGSGPGPDEEKEEPESRTGESDDDDDDDDYEDEKPVSDDDDDDYVYTHKKSAKTTPTYNTGGSAICFETTTKLNVGGGGGGGADCPDIDEDELMDMVLEAVLEEIDNIDYDDLFEEE